MRKFMKRYAFSFLYTNLGLLLISLAIYRRLNITRPYIVVEISSLFIALFITLGILVMRLEKGNSWLNSILGFIIFIPSLFVLRQVYGVIIFRYSFVLYLFIALIAIIYGIALLVVNHRVKNETKELNSLLHNDDELKE